MANDDGRIPSRLIVVAGTYDGVLAGWDTVEHSRDSNEREDIDLKLLRRNDGRHLKLSFATAAHEGSVRCIDVSAGIAADAGGAAKGGSKKRRREDASAADNDADPADNKPSATSLPPLPGTLLSGGYDGDIGVYDLRKHTQIGELRTPSDLGSPLCCSFAPPSNSGTPPTHALVGTTSGKIVLYKKRDWTVQHVLSGHDAGGVHCLAVHPTGRMALSGGRDGKIILWDLTKGRLAYVTKLPPAAGRRGGGGAARERANHVVWSDDGSRYAYCHGTKITARDVAGGEELLDVDVPSRANQLAFVGGPEGMFLAAACDDGGLPVLEVGDLLGGEEGEEEEEQNGGKGTRRAIMAIEPVDGVVAGDDRFKCIRSVEGGSGFLVATANSGGVVSLMDLEGAARMMLSPPEDDDDGGKDSEEDSDSDDVDSDEDEEVEAAVEILDSVRLGSGARITDLAVWSYGGNEEERGADADADSVSENESVGEPSHGDEVEKEAAAAEEERRPPAKKKKGFHENRNDDNKIELNEEEVEKARKLVGQAKKRQKKKKKKLAKKE